jgi:DNA-binding transcriptional LysR family regulator
VVADTALAGDRPHRREDMRWIAGGTGAGETVLGVWPGLRERPRVVATVRDWMGKLQLVAAGLGITTIPGLMAGALPDGVQAVAVRGEPRELRRLVLVVAPGAGDGPGVPVVGDALRSVA